MKQPLFKVGEEVILQSSSAPHLNGECVVLEILNTEEMCIRSNVPIKAIGLFKALGVDLGYGYITTIPTGDKTCWAESALRKKQKPADESFKEMMTKLNRIQAHA